MIFIWPNQGEFLELLEMKEQFLKEDELNQEVQPNRATQFNV